MKHCFVCQSGYRSLGIHLSTKKHIRNTMPVNRVRRNRRQHVSMFVDYEDRMWAEAEARAIEDGEWK